MDIVVKPQGTRSRDGWAEVCWSIETTGQEPQDIIHAVPEHLARWLPSPEQADHVLCASLLHGLRISREQSAPRKEQGSESPIVEVHVEGRVSPRLLAGLEALQDIWTRWRPRRFEPVQLSADREQAAEPRADREGAIFAYSGGVDGTFSLFRHLKGHGGRNRHMPQAAMVVHGMDIPLNQPERYHSVLDRAHSLLDPLGIEVVPVRSNTRVLKQPWEDSFGLQLMACFQLFQTRFEHSVHGSADPYDTLALPWGSTPLTDHLPSTELMQHHLDGAHFDRTEKVAWLSENTQCADMLRVCWQGPELDRNCGQCEKCVRTMLNFWAIGKPVPKAFPTTLTARSVASMKLDSDNKLNEVKSLYMHALENYPNNDPILGTLRRKLTMAKVGKMAYVLRESAALALRGR